ncbi:rhamnogalacturonan acetylesterase [Paenibacillus mesophilus]|nr:rhamnogalacturonan acetylesterase [Paenibacillus mesophilus]TMV47434.1 rhamnogalacturonan acetylesterase [Paenibacillus mesophilus]
MPPLTLYLAGDSTVASYLDKRAPLAGWGQFIGTHFTDRVTVVNAAESGRSSKSFIDEGRLQKIKEEIRKGDYLFIQFGHNDEKTDQERHTDPYTTYKSYLKQYVEAAREKGAFPVLITPMNRRNFNPNGTLAMTHGAYPAAMIQLGKELQVPVIDLHTSSKKLLEQLGDEPSKKLFLWLEPGENANYPEGSKDNTHFNENGASEMAGLVVQGIREAKLPLLDYIKNTSPEPVHK